MLDFLLQYDLTTHFQAFLLPTVIINRVLSRRYRIT